MGSALRSSPPPPLPVGAGTALAVKGRAGAGQGTGTAAPGLLRRTAAFAIFGLLVNGPVFHWWYGALERAAARCVVSDARLRLYEAPHLVTYQLGAYTS